MSDPGLAQLRRYLPVLAVVAAPYAGLGGQQDPLNPLDRVVEWRALLRLVAEVGNLQTETSTRLALARLDPPTTTRLGTALAANGADAFQVVHFVCHGERDLLYLEDDNGHEAYAVAEHVANLFRTSGVRLVIMDGCFSQHFARLLLDETPVQAVVGTRRRVNPENMLAFCAPFYTQLTGGTGVRAAYRAALGHQSAGQADRFELMVRDDVHEVTLALPGARLRAPHPLVTENTVRVIGVPQQPGFVGRRDELTMLAEDLPTEGVRLFALQGPAGIGKSWLAAEFAARFGWRFPDGVLWYTCHAMTTWAEIVAKIARLLDLPAHSSSGAVLEALNGRRILLALDGVDTLTSWAELERLGAWVRDLPAENCAVLTARHVSNLLPRAGESRLHTVTPFSYKAARTLAMRLAVERGIDALDVDTIDDFLDRTRNWPALIGRGVTLVEADGIGIALRCLGELDPASEDPVTELLDQRLQTLVATPELALLVRTQGLPDAFEEGLVPVLNGSAEQIDRLIEHGLLSREGALIAAAPGLRALLTSRWPLSAEQQDLIDQAVLTCLADTWLDQDHAPAQMDHTLWTRLNNLRAAVQRQLRPQATVDLRVCARALAAAGWAFAAAGLAEEFLAYAQGFRERLPEGPELAHLQIRMGEILDLLPDQEGEAGWALEMSLRLDGLDTATYVRACRALGRHLVHVDQVEAAERFLSESLRQLLGQVRRGNVVLAAALAHEWANVLVQLDRHTDAVRRFEAALAGYAEAQEAAFSALAQRDLSRSLLRLGDIDRAEDVLRRALVSADFAGRRDLTVDIRQRLAQVHIERSDEEHQTGQRDTEREELRAAESYLSDALLDALVLDDSA
ncbi:MAG: NACHT domain-containing protein, partial [Anaerolineae bacterium]|nr:NACHT domain-containing protein [Anaerolineae bacterium]